MILQAHLLWEKLFGRVTSKRVATFFDINPRTVQRWYTSFTEGYDLIGIPKPLAEQTREQIAILERTEFNKRLQGLIDEARAAGLHDQVIASWLDAEYERVTGTAIR